MSKFVLTAQLQLQAPNNVRQVVQQIQQQLQGVTVNVQVQNAAQAQRQIQQITQSTNQATTAAERMGKAFALSVRRFAAFSIATRAVSLFTSTLGDAVQSAIDFERQLIKVSQVTGKSIGQLRGLTKQITNLATGFGVASSDLLEVSTVLAQAGLSAEDTAVALRTLAKAALAPNFDSITETAEGAIAILAQFGQGVEALEGQLGSINAVAGAFAVEASDLIDVIRRTGGVFKASGGSLNELLALFTSVRATTRESAESIGTGLRTIFTRIQRPKTIEFLKQFGVELTDLDGKFVGPYEAIRRLSEALSGLGERDITFIQVAEELGGFRQIGKVLPLLQQYSTSQAALNVAMKANNSLSDDAASAQAALAIRIMKVKEEFLALIRSVTETSTFQIMANTALSLASALIKIGDAIKPLLPMLAALAAVKLAKGLGGFFGGMMRGATSGRQYNKGGKVLGFARGGLVPGTGNRDTVPAMLSPGEFVIRKSSVNKMGAGTLAAMNENRYAAGGIANQNRAGMAVGDLINNQKPETATFVDGSASVNARSVLTATPGVPPLGNASLLSRYSGNSPLGELDQIMSKALGFSSRNYQTRAEGITSDEYKSFNDALGPAIENAIVQSAGQLANSMGVKNASPPTFTQDFRTALPKGLIGSLFEIILDSFNDKPISGSESRRPFDFTSGIKPIGTMYKNLDGINYIDAKVSPGNRNTNISSDEFAKKINNQLALDVFDDYVRLIGNQNNFIGPINPNKSNPRTVDAMKKTGAKAKYFGGLIQRFATGGQVVNRGNINYLKSDVEKAMMSMGLSYDDFFKKISAPNSSFDQFMVGGIGPGSVPFPKFLKPYIAKSQAQTEMEKAQAEKAERISTALGKRGKSMRDYGDYGSRRRRFASGGGVGTDTVPALLTPGEFVINRSSAQRIGYGNLNRMNKVGKYANGGIVQRFAAGTPMAGAQPAKSKSNPDVVAFVGLDVLAQQASVLASAQNAQTKAVDTNTNSQTKASSAFQNFGQSLYFSLGGLTAVQAALSSLTPVIDENSSAFERIGATLLNTFSSLTTTIGIAIIALQQMNIQLSLATAKMVAQNALDFLSGAKSLTDLFSTIKGGIPGLKSFTTIFKRGMAGKIAAPGGAGLSRGIGLAGRATQTTLDTGRSLISRGANAINQSKIGVGFNQAFAKPDLNTFSRMFQSKADVTTKAGGVLGRTSRLASDAVGSVGSAITNKIGIGGFKAGNLFGDLSKGFTAGKMGVGLPSTVSANPFASMGGSMGAKAAAGSVTNAGVASFGKAIGTVTKGLNASAGPLLAVEIGLMAASSAVNSFFDYQNKANKAIQEGNAEKASENAVNVAAQESIDSFGSSAILAGAAIGSLVPGVGTLIGGVIGAGVALATKFLPSIEKAISGTDYISYGFIQLGTLFGGNTYDSIKSLAAAQAQGVKTQKALNNGSEAVAKAMKDLENGTITASQAIASNAAAGQEVLKNSETTKKAISDNEKNKSGMVGGFLRGTARVGTLGLAGYMGLESGAQRNARIDKENKELSGGDKKAQEALIQQSTPAINALSRQFAMAGGSFEDVMADIKKNNPGLYFSLVNQGSTQLKQNFDNIAQEVAKAKKAFEALNLGLRGPVATATAAATSLSIFADSLEVGSTPVMQSVSTLEAAFSEAGQAMDPKNVQSAINDVASTLEGFGASDKSVSMFRENAAAFAAVSANYNQVFEGVKKDFSEADFRGLNAQGFTDKFSKNLDEQLQKAGIGDDVRKRMQDVLGNVKLSDDDMNKLRGGDLSVFQKYLDEAGQKTLEEAKKVAEQTAKINQQIINLTKQRIEAERNLVEAQKEALDLTMEGREIQAQYGGSPVTNQERRGNLLAKSNVEGDRLGLTAMKTGDIGELKRRNQEIGQSFANIENKRSKRGGMQGVAGVEADETQKDLQKAYRTQIETIRGLIKLEEDQLKITQEKNKLEKESMESLVKGDVEEFFKKQSAVGATAAIASGDERLMRLYGSEALGTAAMDIQRQKEAGVQSLYGQQLGGPGGLAEAAAGAALSSMGVRDARAAQVMAGTTPEEEASKSRLRQLGGMLGETGQLGEKMAEMQVQTETVVVNAAKLELADIMNRGAEAANAVGMARGGLLYASNGMFVPRGTDTIPAMLTPGEFVVNRSAVNRGNNLRILQAMNNGSSSVSNGGTAMMSRGGFVRYRSDGSNGPEQSSESMSAFTAALEQFNRSLATNIESLKKTEIKIKLDATNVNINLTGTQALASVSQAVKNEILSEVMKKIDTLRATNDGELKTNPGIVPRMA